MFLTDLGASSNDKKLRKLSALLNKDFGIDISIYESLTGDELMAFLGDLGAKKTKIMLESAFNSYHSDPEYTRVVLLAEAIRILLKEIHPKRTLKTAEKVDETLDYKVHTPTGSVVDHDIDEDSPRPDLYWRKHQWEDEQRGENYPVEAVDAPPAGEAYDTRWEANNLPPEECGDTMDAYAPNSQPVGGTAENEQQAGVYVAVMNPNRFLGDEDVNIMSIEPTVNSQNEVSPLSRKVSRIMVDADEQDSEDAEEMTKDIIQGLGGLLESSLLNENELQRAEIVFATNDLIMRLGKMIEDLSKMGTDDIMPLVDGLRENFGPQVAETFSRSSEEKLQGAADGIDGLKQLLDTYREKFEGRISDEDSQQPIDLSNMSGEPEMPELGGDAEFGDDLGGDEGGLDDLGGDEGGLGDLAGEEEGEESLGRAKKTLESMVINVAGKKVKLTMEQIEILHKARLLTEKIGGLGQNVIVDVPATTFLNIGGKKIRITETQLKSLIFAKNFKKRVDEKNANIVKLSESQAHMLAIAKNLTQKVRYLVEKKASKDYDGDGKIETSKDEWKGSKDKAIKKAQKVDEKKLTPAEKKKREEIVKKLKDKPGIEEPYAVATSIAKRVAEEKPSAGLSKKKKSAVVKKAKKGGDIGKKGKGFDKVKKAAAKSGASDPEAVAAAAMWKNVKRESVEEIAKK